MRGKIPIQEFTTPFVTTIPVGRWEQSNNIYKVSIASPSVDENSILDVTVDADTGNNLLSSIYVKPTSTGFDICTDVLPAGSVTVGVFNKGTIGPATYELAADVVNNTTTITSGKVLDARVGKTLQDEITEIQGATPLILAITSGQWSGSGNDYYLEVSASNVTQNSILVPSYDSASAQYLGGPVWCVPADGNFTIHTSKLPTGTVKIMVQFQGVVGIADFQVLSDVYSKDQAVAKADIINDLTKQDMDKPAAQKEAYDLYQLANAIGTFGPELITWGTYNTVGTKITLNSNYKNYRFLVFITGYSATNEVGVTTWLPVSNINYKGGAITIDCSNTSSSGKYMNLKFNSNTEVEIMAVSSGFVVSNALRMIIGLR